MKNTALNIERLDKNYLCLLNFLRFARETLLLKLFSNVLRTAYILLIYTLYMNTVTFSLQQVLSSFVYTAAPFMVKFACYE